MTTTIKSNNDGSSAIQTNGVDRIQIDTSGNTTVVGSLTAGSFPIFTGSNQSLASNGYQKLPGGLIIQWGYATNNTPGQITVTFPLAFPNSCRLILGTPVVNAPLGVDSAQVSSFTSTQVIFNRKASGNGGTISNGNWDLNWFAIGY